MDAILREQARRMAEEMAGGVQTADDLSEVMRMMAKTLIQRALDAEMEVHLGQTKATGSSPAEQDDPAAGRKTTSAKTPSASDKKTRRNRRNGRSSKTVQGDLGEVTIDTPRDRDGSFEPQLVPK